jgi:lipoprotein-releasing system permease protein
MNTKLIASISFALLMARWKQTLVAAIGVTFSIMMFIGLLGFMTGLNELLDGIMLNRTAHVRLFNNIQPAQQQPIDRAPQYRNSYNFIRSVKPKNERLSVYNNGAITHTLQQDPRVLGVAPKVTTQIFYTLGTLDLNGTISGIDVEAESRLFMFNDYVTSGKSIDLKNIPNSIILGIGTAETLLANIGDVIQVRTSKGERFPLKVVGFYRSGVNDVDKVQSYSSIGTTQKLLGEPSSYITDIQVKLRNIQQSAALAQEFKKTFEVETIDIFTANAQFETGSSVRTLISYAVGITLLIVAGFGIYNILNMMIYEKMDSIAILKAVGFSGVDVNRIFISIALSIGVFGGILGLLSGLGVSMLIDQIPFHTAALPNVETYPINYNYQFYVIGILFSIITTYFAGYFPSRKASRIDPVIIIRGK